MAGLTADKIVDAAYGLLVQYGLQDVTMRRIAGALGVQPGALYYHMPNKQELLRLVAYQALSPLGRIGEPPLALMRGLRETVLALRDGGDLVLIAYSLDPELPPVKALRSALVQQGFSAQESDQRSGLLMRFALGSIAVEQNAQLFDRDHHHDDIAESLYEEGALLLLKR